MLQKIALCLLLFSSLEARLVSIAPHLNPPNFINYDRIDCVNRALREEIVEKVKSFSLASYELHTVPTLGTFLLDNKPDCIKDLIRKEIHWDGHLKPYIEKYVKPGTVALDVGSHIGTITFTIAKAVGPTGIVFAFEPQIKTFCELFMNAQYSQFNNVMCIWGALGDKTTMLNLPKFHPDVEVAYLYDFTFGDSGMKAPMSTLDSLGISNISFIKVDVDGCDDIFLDGARETILRNKPIIIMEILGGTDFETACLEKKTQILHTMKKLQDLGYKLEKISAWDYLALPN